MNALAVVVDTSSNLDAIRIQLRDLFEIYFSALDHNQRYRTVLQRPAQGSRCALTCIKIFPLAPGF
jgi:hypothetical protein